MSQTSVTAHTWIQYELYLPWLCGNFWKCLFNPHWMKDCEDYSLLIFLWWCADKSRTMSLEHTKFYLGLKLGVKLHDNILVSGKLSLAEITRNTKNIDWLFRSCAGFHVYFKQKINTSIFYYCSRQGENWATVKFCYFCKFMLLNSYW